MQHDWKPQTKQLGAKLKSPCFIPQQLGKPVEIKKIKELFSCRMACLAWLPLLFCVKIANSKTFSVILQHLEFLIGINKHCPMASCAFKPSQQETCLFFLLLKWRVLLDNNVHSYSTAEIKPVLKHCARGEETPKECETSGRKLAGSFWCLGNPWREAVKMRLDEQQSAFIPVKPMKLKQQQKPMWLHEKQSQTQGSRSNGRVGELWKQPEPSKKE